MTAQSQDSDRILSMVPWGAKRRRVSRGWHVGGVRRWLGEDVGALLSLSVPPRCVCGSSLLRMAGPLRKSVVKARKRRLTRARALF